MDGLFERLADLLAPYDVAEADPAALAAAHRFIDDLPRLLGEWLGSASMVIGRDAFVDPSARLGHNVVIFPGAYVGPGCYLRSSTIVLPGAYLGHAVETNVAVLFHDVQIHHAAVVCQSVIGAGSNLGFAFASATRKLNGRPAAYVSGEGTWEESRGTHHGCVLGRSVRTGVNVTVMPGATVAPGAVLMPHTTVSDTGSAGEKLRSMD